MRQYAVIRCVTIIGEASRRVSQEFQTRHPEIPWRAMTGMRNKVVHSYDEVDLDIVWEVIQHEIPRLIALIQPLVPPDEGT